jgi:hypothetical protein
MSFQTRLEVLEHLLTARLHSTRRLAMTLIEFLGDWVDPSTRMRAITYVQGSSIFDAWVAKQLAGLNTQEADEKLTDLILRGEIDDIPRVWARIPADKKTFSSKPYGNACPVLTVLTARV